MMKKIFFRADASAEIGYGHFIRTLALADMLKDDFDCVFYTQDPTEYQKRELLNVCPFVALPADESRFGFFLELLKGDEIVVLDNYFFTTDYQKAVKAKGCKLVCIDDMHNKRYVADVIINHSNVPANAFDIEQYTRLCIGMQYILLRLPFLKPLHNYQRNNNVVVNFGGSDPFRLTDKIVTMLCRINVPYHIVVILGDKTFLSESNRGKVEICKNLSAQEIAELFETSAFGIFPTSTVSLEAISRGLPLMLGYYMDNQLEGYKNFTKRANYIPLGYLPDLSEKELIQAMEALPSFVPTTHDFGMVPENYLKLFKSL